jgi:hypothetical protein
VGSLGLAISPDGLSILYPRIVNDSADLMLIENVRCSGPTVKDDQAGRQLAGSRIGGLCLPTDRTRRKLLREMIAGPIRFTPVGRTYRFEWKLWCADETGVSTLMVPVRGYDKGFPRERRICGHRRVSRKRLRGLNPRATQFDR